MKIVDRKTFLSMPENTLFSKYSPCHMEEFAIKLDTLETNDFIVQYIDSAIEHTDSGNWSSLLDKSQATGCSLPMDFNCSSRDGCFDDYQLFAVWEKEDVRKLIDRLALCLDAP